ncbi:hypothetical protein HK100_010084 [Physocladia obscura]|uniref:DUF2421 domain-containing protein n=1 Tax=Physocladia obscura TaxID=109957 RepID=A0AAD5SMM6_9FUNG|nr:hypothetical protein HK100_010084 [Physocladia obscura]
MSGALVTIMVAVSPSLGQTYTSIPFQILAASLGASFAFAAVKAVGISSFWLICFAAIVGVPFSYLLLSRQPFTILGLLTLLAFSNYVCIVFANSTNPLFDIPSTYLYKIITVSAVTLTFCVALNITLYPTFARQILQRQMFEIFRDFSILYSKIIISTIVVLPEDSKMKVEDGEIKEIRNIVMSKLAGLEPLMAFARVEPRLEGEFQIDKYRNLIQHIHRLLGRIECLRVSGGGKPMDATVQKVFSLHALGEARKELQATVRLLLYIFASVMITKQPLPATLPNASAARERLFEAFIAVIMNHVHKFGHPEGDPLEGIVPDDKEGVLATLNTEIWLRLLSFSACVREVSSELDELSEAMEDIFGKYPDFNSSHNETLADDGWLV